MPLKRQQRIVVNHAAAIVNHANHALAARFDFHANRPRPRIQRVFEQLLHDRRGPLDHFASGDLVCNVLRKYAYSWHVSINCSANLQVGIRESKVCPPEGGRYTILSATSLPRALAECPASRADPRPHPKELRPSNPGPLSSSG